MGRFSTAISLALILTLSIALARAEQENVDGVSAQRSQRSVYPPLTQADRQYSPPTQAYSPPTPKVNVACCLPNWPADYHGQPEPLFNRLLFQECPSEKTPEEICQAASEALVHPPSRLVANPHKSHLSESTRFYYNKATSPTSADLVVVSKGCCFNLYPGVSHYQPLSSQCQNTILGDNLELLNSIFSTSVITAGDTNVHGVFDRSVVMGGDYLNRDEKTTTIAKLYYGGPYDTAGLVVVGDIAQVGGPIEVTLGDVFLGGADLGERIVDESGQLKVLEDKKKAIAKISTRVCALSQNIAALETNSNVVETLVSQEIQPQAGEVEAQNVIVLEDLVTFDFVCQSDVTICVFEITSEQISRYATEFKYTSGLGKTIKINVSGLIIDIREAVVQVPVNVPVVWNFYEAVSVTIKAEKIWSGSVICPQCQILEVVTTEFVGTMAVGNPESTLSLKNFSTITLPIVTSLSARPNCPPPQPKVAFCECVCPANMGYTPYTPLSLVSKP